MKAQQAGSKSEVRKSRSAGSDSKSKSGRKDKSKSKSGNNDDEVSGKTHKFARSVIRKRRQRTFARTNHKKTVLSKAGIDRVIKALADEDESRDVVRFDKGARRSFRFLAEHFAKDVIFKASRVSRNEGTRGSVVLKLRHFVSAGVPV